VTQLLRRPGRGELSTLGKASAFEPVYHLGQARPIPNEAIKIIQPLWQTGRHYGVARRNVSSASLDAKLGRSLRR
jgi:hypothetical protein